MNVVIDFNFDLAFPSSISILRDNQEYGVGKTIIDANKLAMRRTMSPEAPDGVYTVEYKACWPDQSCHTGHFQFAIDQSLKNNFIDMRNQNDTIVKLSAIKFIPQNMRIKKGTKITWVNDDSVDHYINTDAHPSHTYFRGLNSSVLKQGNSYSFQFNERGVYPYHCSAHADSMIGTVVVE